MVRALTLRLSLVCAALTQSQTVAYDELAAAMLAAGTAEERAALLAARPELVTADLSLALGRISDRLREEKKFQLSREAGFQALEVAERAGDRPAQGLAWEHVGRAYAGERDYQRAAEHFQKGVVLFEALGDRQMASSLLGRIAACFIYLENYRAALETNLRRLKLKEELNDPLMIARTLDDITLTHYRLGDYPAALVTARRAMALYEPLGNEGGVARMLVLLGDIQLEQSDYELAMATYGQAGKIFERLGDVGGVGLTTLNVGETYSGRGDYRRALDAYEKALATFTPGQLLDFMALANHSIGTVHATLGDYELARESFQRSVVLYDKAKRPVGLAEAFNAIGNSYQRQGDYGRALEYLRQGLKLLEESGRKMGMADALAELGDLYFQQGDESQALELYDRSQILLEQLGRKEKLAALVSRRGLLQRRRGDDRGALAAHQQSLALYQAIGNKRGMAETLALIGDDQERLAQSNPARRSYQQALDLFEEIGDRNGIAAALTGIARLERASGNHEEALSIAARAAALAEKTSNLELLWEIDSLIGSSRQALGQTEAAQSSFERAVAAVELMRSQAAGGPVDRRYFLQHRLLPYHSLIQLLVAGGKAKEALVWAERSKARVLLDVMRSGRVDVSQAMTAAEQQQERALRAAMISLNTQVHRASGPGRSDPARLEELKSLRERARLDYEAFQTSLFAAHPALRVQRGEAPVITTGELAALLPDSHSALIEYVVTDDVTYLFAVTRAANREPAVQVFSLPVGRAGLSLQIETFRRQLAMRDLGFGAAARRLHQMLLAPAQEVLRGKTNLVLVLDDKLWELPFQALLDGERRYLIETRAISYAPSLTVLREMKRPRGGPGTGEALQTALLAFGNPTAGGKREHPAPALPETEEEVKALKLLYGAERSKVYVRSEAREDRVRNEAARIEVLHFATHGTLNDAAPMYSHLVLAPGQKNDDGLLEAWELMQMDLQSKLAVLSACETARGRYGPGEGMIGFTWALFVAGVPATVVSQWQVEAASTRDLMVSFHRGLRKATKSEALRQAALRIMKTPETSHPFYWAGFVLVGDGS
jgi:CHAT domain-containing protein/predicted negative regulator of RcsB-dependent stress response